MCMDWDRNTHQWHLGHPDPSFFRQWSLLRSSNNYEVGLWTLTIDWSVYEDGSVLVRLTVLDRSPTYRHRPPYPSAVLYFRPNLAPEDRG